MSTLQFEKSGEGIERITPTTKVGSGSVDYTIERPDRRHFGGEVTDEIVLYLTGWTETEDSLKALRIATARRGMAAATLYQPRYINPFKVARAHHLRVENVAAVVAELEKDYASVSLAGHSFGGVDGTRATFERELSPRVLALMGSAGLIMEGLRQVSPRVLEELIREESPELIRHPIRESGFVLESIKTVLRNPVLATSEAIAAASQYVGRHVLPITESGTVMINIMATRDRIFPYELLKESTKGLPFDVTETIKDANHNFTNTHAGEVAGIITAAVIAADAIRAQRVERLAITTADVEQDLFGVVY